MGGQGHVPIALRQGETRYPLYRWLGGLGWTSGPISPSKVFDPRNRPARNESLFQLRYPGPMQTSIKAKPSRNLPKSHRWEKEACLYPFSNTALQWGRWSTPLLGHFTYPLDTDPVPFVLKAG